MSERIRREKAVSTWIYRAENEALDDSVSSGHCGFVQVRFDWFASLENGSFPVLRQIEEGRLKKQL
jgi:hypothetical protein